MSNSLFDRFTKPQPEEDAAFHRMIITALIISILITILSFATVGPVRDKIVLASMTILLAASLILASRRILAPARFLVPATIFAVLVYFSINGNGFRNITNIGFAAVIVLAGLFLGEQGAIFFGAAAALFMTGIGFAEIQGIYIPPHPPTLAYTEDVITAVLFYLGTSGILFVLLRRYNQIITEAQASEQAQAKANQELLELKDSLEKRVTERTQQLETINQQNTRRAAQFESIAQTARSMTSLQNLSSLLPHITELISQQFGFYHVGIFLLDNEGEYAVLTAANSAGGTRMIEKGHKLKVGQVGIVGYAAGSGIARIALDTGRDAVYFDNPDLPDTHSEMALPLKLDGRVIGVLDVQSTEPSAFTNEDIASLSILADQVSIAIENTRQYEATLRSLEQTESTYRQYIQREWLRLTQEENLAGYRYASGFATRLDKPIDLGDAHSIVNEGRIYQRLSEGTKDAAELAVPVKLRGEVIGVLNISAPNRNKWTDDEIDIVEAVADRLAFSIENARLFQVTNIRAERERVASEIASKIGGNIRMESLLRTAAQELSQAMSGAEVLIQLQSAKQLGGAQ